MITVIKFRQYTWVRIVAVVLTAAFLNQDIAWAQDALISLPKDRAVIRESWQAPGKMGQSPSASANASADRSGTVPIFPQTTIINIQDAHAYLGAQESIASILGKLVSNYDLKVIAIEGSSGYIDTSLLKTFPDKKIRDKSAYALMKEGRMSAGEFFSITSDRPVALYGIEEEVLYRKNLEEFRKLDGAREAVDKDLSVIIKALRALADKAYPAELKALESSLALYRDGKIPFSRLWMSLMDSRFHGNDKGKMGQSPSASANASADRSGTVPIFPRYKNLAKFAALTEAEKAIDFTKANRERSLLIAELSKGLPKPALNKLLRDILAFKKGGITAGDFHSELRRLAVTQGIGTARYPNLAAYTSYIVEYESLDVIGISDELKAYSGKIKEGLFTNDRQRELSRSIRFMELVSGLFNLELSGGEFEEFLGLKKTGQSFFNVIPAQAGIHEIDSRFRGNDEIVGIRKIFDALPEAIEFYKTAEGRNRAIIENTIRRMTAEGRNIAALITGGYHTSGLKDLLREKNCSYVVILPKFDASNGERPYVTILTNKKSSYAPLLKDGRYYLATSAYFQNDPSISEAERFRGYSTDFSSALKDAVAGIEGEAARKRAMSGLVELWIDNYKIFYEEFMREQAGRATPVDYIPRDPGKVSEYLRALVHGENVIPAPAGIHKIDSRFHGNDIRYITKPVRVVMVMPMYKEERRLGPKSAENPLGEDALRKKVKAIQMMRRLNPLFECRIIAVDDGSPGNSSARLVEELWSKIQEEYSARGEKLDPLMVSVRAIKPEDKMGKKGGAVHLGMARALEEGWTDYIGYTDVDTSISMDQIDNLIRPLYNGESDVAIGSRWCEGASREGIPWSGIISSRIYNWVVRILLPPLFNIRDTQRGFKLFTKDVIKDILPLARDRSLSFDTELLLLSKLSGRRLHEVAVDWVDSAEARTFSAGIESMKMLWGVLRQQRHILRYAGHKIADILEKHSGPLFIVHPGTIFPPEKTPGYELPAGLAGKTLVTLSMEGNIPEFAGHNAQGANTKGGLGAYYGDKLEGLHDIGIKANGIMPMYSKVMDEDRKWIDVNYDELVQRGILERVNEADGSALKLYVTAWDEWDKDNDDKNPLITVQVYKVNRGGTPLYLLKCPQVFDILYADDKSHGEGGRAHRFTQEIVFGKAVYQLLVRRDVIPEVPDILHLNEAHTVVAAAQVRSDKSGIFNKTSIVYTNHTLVPAGLETFRPETVKAKGTRMLYHIGIPWGEHEAMHSKFKRPDGVIDFCHAAIQLADVINAVSKEHAIETERMFRDLYGTGIKVDVVGILNGSGKTWKGDELINAEASGRRPDKGELWDIHERSKQEAYEEIRSRTGVALDPEKPTLWAVRRLVDYKSQYPMLRFLLHIMCADRGKTFTRDELKSLWYRDIPDLSVYYNAELSERVLDNLFEGRTHINGLDMQVVVSWPEPGYEDFWVKEFDRLSQIESLKGRFVYVPRSDTKLLKMQAIGADICVNMPRPLEEACGTSDQRTGLNGGINIAVNGAGPAEWIIDYTADPQNGNGFLLDSYTKPKDGKTVPDLDSFYRNCPSDIFKKAQIAVDLFRNNREEWKRLMHNSYTAANSKVTALAMEKRYADEVYVLALERTVRRQADESRVTQNVQAVTIARPRPITKSDFIPSYAGLAPGFTHLLDEAQDIIPRSITEGEVGTAVVNDLGTNSVKYIDDDGKAWIVFDHLFVETLIRYRTDSDYPGVAAYLLAERIIHELAHSNVALSEEKREEEETRIIMQVDLPLHRRLAKNEKFKALVDSFFTRVKPQFPSGRYYGKFLGHLAGLDPALAEPIVRRFVAKFYKGADVQAGLMALPIQDIWQRGTAAQGKFDRMIANQRREIMIYELRQLFRQSPQNFIPGFIDGMPNEHLREAAPARLLRESAFVYRMFRKFSGAAEGGNYKYTIYNPPDANHTELIVFGRDVPNLVNDITNVFRKTSGDGLKVNIASQWVYDSGKLGSYVFELTNVFGVAPGEYGKALTDSEMTALRRACEDLYPGKSEFLDVDSVINEDQALMPELDRITTNLDNLTPQEIDIPSVKGDDVLFLKVKYAASFVDYEKIIEENVWTEHDTLRQRMAIIADQKGHMKAALGKILPASDLGPDSRYAVGEAMREAFANLEEHGKDVLFTFNASLQPHILSLQASGRAAEAERLTDILRKLRDSHDSAARMTDDRAEAEIAAFDRIVNALKINSERLKKAAQTEEARATAMNTINFLSDEIVLGEVRDFVRSKKKKAYINLLEQARQYGPFARDNMDAIAKIRRDKKIPDAEKDKRIKTLEGIIDCYLVLCELLRHMHNNGRLLPVGEGVVESERYHTEEAISEALSHLDRPARDLIRDFTDDLNTRVSSELRQGGPISSDLVHDLAAEYAAAHADASDAVIYFSALFTVAMEGRDVSVISEEDQPHTIYVTDTMDQLHAFKFVDKNPNVASIATETGNSRSHWVITIEDMLMKGRETPIIVIPGIPDLKGLKTDDLVIVDAERRRLVRNPQSNLAVMRYYEETRREREIFKEIYREHRMEDARTKDGVTVSFLSDIPRVEPDAALTQDYGAAGIGLIRMENMYMQEAEPKEEDIYAAALKAARAIDGPVTFRTLDMEKDKLKDMISIREAVGFTTNAQEERYAYATPEQPVFYGVPFYFEDLKGREIIRTQLRALMRACADSKNHNIRITIPMVENESQAADLAVLIEEVKAGLVKEGVSRAGLDRVLFGAMIETPGACSAVKDILEEGIFSYISIGTNDLSKRSFSDSYERDDERLEKIYHVLFPAFVRNVRTALQGLNEYNTHLPPEVRAEAYICGEWANSRKFVFYIIGLMERFTAIKVRLVAKSYKIGELKEYIRHISLMECADEAGSGEINDGLSMLSERVTERIMVARRVEERKADKILAETTGMVSGLRPEASDIIVGIPAGVITPEGIDGLRGIISSTFPKLTASVIQIDTNSPEDSGLAEAAQRTGARHGIVLDLPYTEALAALREYLGKVEDERFAAENPGIVVMNETTLDTRSIDEIKEVIDAAAASIPAASPATLEALKASMARLEARTASIQKSVAHNESAKLTTFIDNKERAVSITTQGILDSEMAYAMRDKIKARWARLGIGSKKDDPIKEVVVITDPALAGDRRKVERYIDILGLTQYVDTVTADELYGVAAQYKAAGIEHIGIRAIEGEIENYAPILKELDGSTIKLELGTALDTNSYEVLLELFSQDGDWTKIPGVSKKDGNNIFRYIPKALPLNYEKEIRVHREAVKLLMSAA